MKDYTIAQWIDFARGISPENEARQMREHLAGGCASCQELATFCDSLAQVCRGASDHVAPEPAARCARAIFPAPIAKPSQRRFRLPIEMIYNSFLSPVPVGLRASWELGFQALYHAGDYSLDFRVEPGPPDGHPTIVGQIANRKMPEADMAGFAVSLKAGRAIVAQTRSNRFGEFQFEYEERKGLRLKVELENEQEVEVPLRQLANTGSKSS
jgi:hypothetical protein